MNEFDELAGGARAQQQARFDEARDALEAALHEIKRVIVGQDAMLERLLVALLAGGHVLLEGVPGLAKTLTVKTLAQVLGGTFKRIQFTPDLVPSDLVGTRIYRPDTGRFDTELGPVFGNFLLADEINRAPAKVQSALLEVMQEHQVTIGGQTFPVPHPFLVMATQNPIESEGTYPLPEAQVDRFLLKIVVDYPTFGEEAAVVGRSLSEPADIRELLSLQDLERFAATSRGVDQRDRAARARAERDEGRQRGQAVLVGAARRGRQLERVADEARVDVDVADARLHRAQLVDREQLRELGRRHQRALDDRQLLVVLGVVDEDLEHEAVDLRLRQRVGALRLDRVLRRHHEERVGHPVRRVAERDLALLHHLEQRRLHLGGGAVDLVRQQEVAEDGAELGVEGRVVGPVDTGADQIGRHQVGR
ncbi:MAG: MoxR-like ATPase, partial [Solirubrobacteraceae bacterium]|nr:MoxR-like ATPase [Solirubrobacteraceae bacterium]